MKNRLLQFFSAIVLTVATCNGATILDELYKQRKAIADTVTQIDALSKQLQDSYKSQATGISTLKKQQETVQSSIGSVQKGIDDIGKHKTFAKFTCLKDFDEALERIKKALSNCSTFLKAIEDNFMPIIGKLDPEPCGTKDDCKNADKKSIYQQLEDAKKLFNEALASMDKIIHALQAL